MSYRPGRCSCQGPSRLVEQYFEYVGPFFGEVRSSGRVDQQHWDTRCEWDIMWTRRLPHHRTKSEDLKELVARIQAWNKAHEGTEDCIGPFVTACEFFHGNGDELSIQLPTWPRTLTLDQSVLAVDGMVLVPGVTRALVEIGNPLIGTNDGWPLANDLVFNGPVSERLVVEYWDRHGLTGASKRVGHLESLTLLGPEPGDWHEVEAGRALWTSLHLGPCWTRVPSGRR